MIDPLYWNETKDNIAKLARLGILDWINCTLNSRNYSLFDNIEYWNKWRQEIGIMDKEIFIKLNHIYPGTPPVTKKWMFNDFDPFPQYESVMSIKKGEEIGDLNFRGKILHEYLHEYRKLGLLYINPNAEKSLELRPYFGYIKGQINRWQIIQEGEENKFGSCRQFQTGLSDKNFAIDTVGEYCQCNLIDSSSTVKNPSGKRPEKCKTCKYTRQSECFPCGSEFMDEDCEHNYYWCQMLEEFEQLKLSLEALSSDNQCNCSCDDNENPIYCVKNYKL